MDKGARFPTTEVLGYCQMSLRDRQAMSLQDVHAKSFLQIAGLHPGSSCVSAIPSKHARNGPSWRRSLRIISWREVR